MREFAGEGEEQVFLADLFHVVGAELGQPASGFRGAEAVAGGFQAGERLIGSEIGKFHGARPLVVLVTPISWPRPRRRALRMIKGPPTGTDAHGIPWSRSREFRQPPLTGVPPLR